MSVVVTGGAGFIGSNLVEALNLTLDKTGDSPAIVIDNLHTGSPHNLPPTYRDPKLFLRGGISRITELKPRLIFHLGMPSSSPLYAICPNLNHITVAEALTLFEHARRSDTEKVVVASTSSVYENTNPPQKETDLIYATSLYAQTRLCVEKIAEHYAKSYGVDTTVLRLFSVYGPHEEYKRHLANLVTQFIHSLHINDTITIYGDGSQTRDFIYVGDVVRAFIIASKYRQGYSLYNVGTGYNYSLNDLVYTLEEVMDRRANIKYTNRLPKGYVKDTWADITRISNDLGFKPQYSLRQGIAETLKYYYNGLYGGEKDEKAKDH